MKTISEIGSEFGVKLYESVNSAGSVFTTPELQDWPEGMRDAVEADGYVLRSGPDGDYWKKHSEIFDISTAAAALGRKGGSVSSPAKAAAARANAKLPRERKGDMLYETQARNDNYWLKGRSIKSLLVRAGWPRGSAAGWADEFAQHGSFRAVDGDFSGPAVIGLLPNGREVRKISK